MYIRTALDLEDLLLELLKYKKKQCDKSFMF